MKPIEFNSAEEMYDYIISGRDLYSVELETYVFVYNDVGSIAYYSLVPDSAKELAIKAEKIGDYWGALLGVGGYIVDSEDYEDYQKGDETPLDWCQERYQGKWFDTEDYGKELKDEV